jgi:DNA polymerase III subunit epsilon
LFGIQAYYRKYLFFHYSRLLQSGNVSYVEKDYLERLKQEIPGNGLVDSPETRYVVFDTETTGLNSKKDILLSIGGVAIYGNSLRVSDSFYELIQVKREKGKDIPIHGILPSESLQGKEEKEVLLDFLNFIGNSILIAHHIDFDLGFINQSLSKFSSLKILNRSLDTAKLAERIEEKMNPYLYREDRKQFQLDSLAKKYEIPSFSRHHALTDAITTAILFLKLQRKWIRYGNSIIKDFPLG